MKVFSLNQTLNLIKRKGDLIKVPFKFYSNKKSNSIEKAQKTQTIGVISQDSLSKLKILNYSALFFLPSAAFVFIQGIHNPLYIPISFILLGGSLFIHTYTKNICVKLEYIPENGCFKLTKLNFINKEQEFTIPNNLLKQIRSGLFRGNNCIKHTRNSLFFSLDELKISNFEIINSKISSKYKNHKNTLFQGKTQKDFVYLKKISFGIGALLMLIMMNSFFNKRDEVALEFIEGEKTHKFSS